MFIMTFKKFNESMFSFFGDKKLNTKSFKGKIVAIDTNFKNKNEYNLIHIYEIVNTEGTLGKFLGNIRHRNGKFYHFKECDFQIVENISNWRDLSDLENKYLKKNY